MRYTILFLVISLLSLTAGASDTLTVEQVRRQALQESPLQQQKALAETIAALQLHNIRSNQLPRVAFGAQASYQSDVFKLPIDNPILTTPDIPRDQYRLTVDISERIWDGNRDSYLRRQRQLERDLALTQTDVDVFQLREAVTELYFQVLLLQESEAVLNSSLEILNARKKQAAAAVSEGVSLRSNLDQVDIQILQIKQQMAAIQADQQTLKNVLAVWLNRQDTDFHLATNPAETTTPAQGPTNKRPEYQLFALRQQQLELGQDMLRLQAQPRVDLFAQAGLGRPNPFNFFETGFEPFGIIGLRASWTPVDWGNRSREREVLSLQRKKIDTQRLAFEQRLEATTTKDRAAIAKARSLLEQDDAIIQLQEDIVERADAQVKNGIMTTTDYLNQLNLLTQARLSRTTHEIQAMQAAELLKAKLEN